MFFLLLQDVDDSSKCVFLARTWPWDPRGVGGRIVAEQRFYTIAYISVKKYTKAYIPKVYQNTNNIQTQYTKLYPNIYQSLPNIYKKMSEDIQDMAPGLGRAWAGTAAAWYFVLILDILQTST